MENIFYLIIHGKLKDIELLNLSKVVKMKNYLGQTPLIVACQEGQKEIVKLLLKAGADIGHVDKLGYTALEYAEQKGYIGIMTILKLKK